MTNRRDIELLISARDTSAKTFQQVAANVSHLSTVLKEQTEAAEKGDVSLKELEATQRALGQAAKELADLQTAIDRYAKLTAELEKNETAAAAAAKQYDEFRAKLDAAGKTTDAQERRLANYEKRQGSTARAVEQTRTSIAAQAEVLEKAGIGVDSLAGSQDRIVLTAKEIGANLASVAGTLDGYDAKLNELAASEARAAAEAKVFDDAVGRGNALAGNVQFVRFMAAALDDQALSQQRATEATRQAEAINAQETASLRQLNAELTALNAFRQVGQDAVEAANDMSRFVQAGQTVSISTHEIAAGLRALIDPASAATASLDGLQAKIDAAAATADADKRRVSEYSTALNELSEASAGIVRQGAAIDTFNRQAEAVEAAQRKFDAAAAEVAQYGRAIATADAPSKELTASLRQAEAALDASGRALVQEETKLGELSRGLKQAGVDTNDLTGAQARLQAMAKQTGGAAENLNAKLGRGGQKSNGLFGLNPYEIQNLGFQLNDVFTQLASGSSIFQTLAQQGGQITQIFPGSIALIARFALAWSPVIIAVGAAVAVIKRAVDQQSAIEGFSKALAVQNDGGLYDPVKLAATAEKVEELGVSAKDAQAAILTFTEAGVDPSKIDAFTVAAVNMAHALGEDVPTAAKALADGLGGGYDAVVKLDEKTNVLTATEREHIKALFDSGQGELARQRVFDLTGKRMDELAARSRGVWQVAFQNLKSAWNSFLDTLANTRIVQNAIRDIKNVGVAFAFLTGLLAGKSVEEAGREATGAASALGALQSARAKGQQQQARQDKIDQDYIDNLKEQTTNVKHLTAAETVRLAGVKALRQAQNAGLSDKAAKQAQQIAEAAERQNIADNPNFFKTGADKAAEAANKRATAAAAKAQREAEAAQRKIEGVQSTLTGQLRTLDAAQGKGDNAPLEDRLKTVDDEYAKIFDTISKLRNLGISKSADGRDLDTIAAQAEAAKQQLKDQTTLSFYEKQANALVDQRKSAIAEIADKQKDTNGSVVEAFTAAKAINDEMSPKIVEAARNALQIAEAINAVRPSPELQKTISDLKALVAGNGAGVAVQRTVEADVGREGLANQETALNKTISDRNALVESYNRLQQVGLLSVSEARQKTAQAYADNAKSITEQTAAIQGTVTALHDQHVITDTVYQNWIAKIQTVNEESKYTDDRIIQINEAAQQAIANGVTDAFDTAGKSIVNLIGGTESFGDAIKDLGKTALNFAASFLKALAQVFTQLVALQVAKSLIGGGGGGLGSFFIHHSGGVVGSGNAVRRSIPATAILGAPRFHTGNSALGLKSDEYTAILQRGEEVLNDNDPRHVDNIGRGGGTPAPAIKQVLHLDPEEIPRAMQGRSGERTFMTFIKTNAETIKQVLG